MQLSILIPVYGVARYLPALLEILSLSLPEQAEVIFFDDASPDDSVRLIQQFQAAHAHLSVRLIRSPHNIGLTRARAALLDASQAEYVWFVDSDDLIDGDAISAIATVLAEHQPDVLLFDYTVFYDGSGAVKKQEQLAIDTANSLVGNHHHALYQLAIMDGKHYFWNKVFRRRCIEGVVDFQIPAFEDIAYTPILLDQCQSYYYLPRSLVHYRIRSDSIAQTVGLKQVYGLTAYLLQADYARKQLGAGRAYAYLLYKACMYYYRMHSNLQRSDLSGAQYQQVLVFLQTEYAKKQLNERQICVLLWRQGLMAKALKLVAKSLQMSIIDVFRRR